MNKDIHEYEFDFKSKSRRDLCYNVLRVYGFKVRRYYDMGYSMTITGTGEEFTQAVEIVERILPPRSL